MKCKNNVDGKVCGEDIPPSSKFCGICGGKVVTEDDNTTKACPKCSFLITNRQKFCSGCAWKIDPSIFLQKKIFCQGLTPENKICGVELSPDVKFCCECGTVQRIPTGETQQKVSEPVREVKVDEFMKEELPQRQPHESSGSGSSSRSESPDTWRLPDIPLSTPDPSCKDNEIHATGGPHLPLRSIGEHTSEENEETADSLQEKGREMRESSTISYEENVENSGDLEMEDTLSSATDTVNNNVTEPTPSQETMETEPNTEGGNSWTWNTENSETLSYENRSALTQNITGSDVIKPHPFTLPSSITAPLDGVPSEPERETTEKEHMEESSGNPPVENEPHNMGTGSKQPSQGKSKVQELTKKFESTVTIESSSENQEGNNGSPKLKREISHSSAGSELGSEVDSGPSEEDEEDDKDDKDDQVSEEAENRTGKKKTKLSKAEKNRLKKKQRKERNKRRKLNLPEEDPNSEDKGSTKLTKNKTESSSASKKDDLQQIKTDQTISNEKKEDDEKKQYQTRSVTQAKNTQDDLTINKNVHSESMETQDEKTSQEAKSQQSKNAAQKKDEKKSEPKSAGSENLSAGKSSGDDKTTSKTTVGGKKSAFAEVYFHIIVSPSLLADPKSGDMFVHFQQQTLGGWKSRKHKLIHKRNLPDEYMDYQVMVKIPKELLYKPLYYSYYVVKNGNEEVNEYVYNFASETNHRTIYSNSNRNRDIIHQYDGVVKKKPEEDKKGSIFKTIHAISVMLRGNDFNKHLKMEAAFSLKHFLPQVQLSTGDTVGIAGEEIVQHLESIYDGLKSTYVVTAGLWMPTSEFRGYLYKELREYITDVVAKLQEKRKSPVAAEDQVLHIVAALVMVYLKDTYGIDLGDTGQQRLCKALLPFLEKEKKMCPEFEDLELFFPILKKRISDSLLKMVKSMARDSSKTCVFYCIPLLHFLLGKYIPYQPPSAKVDHDAHVPEWWGVAEFSQDWTYFQRKTKWDRDRMEVLQAIEPYFTIDYLLPRTYVAALTYNQLIGIGIELLPTDAILAAMYYYIKSKLASSVYLYTHIVQNIKDILEMVSARLFKSSEDGNYLLETPMRNYKIAGDILNFLYTTRRDEKFGLCLAAAETFLIAVDWFTKCYAVKVSQGEKGTYVNHLTCYEYHREKVKNVLEHYYGHEVNVLKLWNKALTLRIPDGEIKSSFVHFIRDNLEPYLEKRAWSTDVKLIEIYCENLESFCDTLQEVLSKLAYRAVETESNFKFGTCIRGAALMRFGTLLSQVFERSMDFHQLSDQHKILDYTLNWAPFSTHVKIFYHTEYSTLLSDTSKDLIGNFVEIVKRASEALARGNILVSDLEIILGKMDHFKSVINEIKDIPVEPDYLLATLPLRQKELAAYQASLKIVQEFIYMCTRFRGNTSFLEQKIKSFEKLENVSLNSLCKVAMLNETKHPEEYQPTVIAFELDEHIVQTIPYILKCGQGLLFITLWDRRGNELAKQKGRSLDLDEILTEVWEPTYKFWDDLCTRLKNGDLKFSEFEKFFKTTDMETLRNELMKLCQDGNTKWIDIWLDQLEKYRYLQSCLFGARAIMEVVKEFELTGNFNQVLEILKLTGNADTKMNTLDDNMMKTCKILTGIDEEKAKSLRTFIACKPLVVWLRETMPSGLKELKVFVDLASISAGEGDYEMDKVNCLRSATTGYSPLIFSLDQNCDAALFLHRCEEVWKELKADSKLPKKLVDTQRQLYWLKSVKQTHGSVEVTSLAQAEAINTNGIYQVGNLKKTATIKNPMLLKENENGI